MGIEITLLDSNIEPVGATKIVEEEKLVGKMDAAAKLKDPEQQMELDFGTNDKLLKVLMDLDEKLGVIISDMAHSHSNDD